MLPQDHLSRQVLSYSDLPLHMCRSGEKCFLPPDRCPDPSSDRCQPLAPKPQVTHLFCQPHASCFSPIDDGDGDGDDDGDEKSLSSDIFLAVVSGNALPRSLGLVFGKSGSGKTTLMQVGAKVPMPMPPQQSTITQLHNPPVPHATSIRC